MNQVKLFLVAILCMAFLAGCGQAETKPCALLAFEEVEGNMTQITEQRLAEAALLTVGVNHCEYGEPTQTIDDETIIAAVCKALSEMTVTGRKDSLASTADTTTYSLSDAEGKNICYFSFQQGLLLGKEGRYTVEGLDALEDIDGILLADDWQAYWESQNET